MKCPTTGKESHATREAAQDHQSRLVYRNYLDGESERSKGLNVYPCQACEAWHVGHTNTPKMPLVYHYTVQRYLDRILASGALKPPTSRAARARSAAFNEPNPLLWFSWNSVWEYSVLKDPRPRDKQIPPTGRAITELWGEGLIRFSAPASVAKLRWNDYLARNDTPGVQRKLMSQWGNPADWLATDQPVPLTSCRAIEVWYNGCWVDCASVSDDFDTYIEGRQETYLVALYRLLDKMDQHGLDVVGEDDAERILLEDYRQDSRIHAWKQDHLDEIRQFAANMRVKHGRRRRRRREEEPR